MNCNDSLRATITAHLANFPVDIAAAASGRAAAVAVAVTDSRYGADLSGMPTHAQPHEGAALILTRRSSKLRSHPGQWALPGGRIDPGETPQQTALREMREEVGLDLDESCVLGRLDDFVTRSGFIMTPIVVWAGPRRDLVANPDEVDSIHRIPVTEFLRADAPILEPTAEGGAPVLRMPVGDNWIAAPTAAILFQFREVCLLGNATRVAHYEQPGFAWR
ncbi:MAG: CoA pyrophosphatase [Burkholderiales bacterium]|nr:CoA pyrophosphatase [Burkholderiales bacterium]